MFLSSRQPCSSIRSGSADVSFIRVSRLRMKSNSAARMSSSCCRFLGAPSSMTQFIRTYRTTISSIGPSRYSCTEMAGYDPGSFVVVGSSGDEETVDSVSYVAFCTLIVSGLISVVDHVADGISSPKSLKYPPPRCESRHSSFLRRRMSILFISFWSPSFGLLGRRISLSSFLCH